MQESQDHSNKIDILRHDLHLGAYPIGFIYSVINRYKRSDCLKKEVEPLRFIPINYTRGVSEKFKGIVNRYNKGTFQNKTYPEKFSYKNQAKEVSTGDCELCLYYSLSMW